MKDKELWEQAAQADWEYLQRTHGLGKKKKKKKQQLKKENEK